MRTLHPGTNSASYFCLRAWGGEESGGEPTRKGKTLGNDEKADKSFKEAVLSFKAEALFGPRRVWELALEKEAGFGGIQRERRGWKMENGRWKRGLTQRRQGRKEDAATGLREAPYLDLA